MLFITDRAISLCGKIILQLDLYYGVKLMALVVLLLTLISSRPGFGGNMEFSGQAAGAVTVGTDPAINRSHFEEAIGYIPTLSIGQPIKPDNLIDFETSLNSTAVLDGFLGSGEGGSDTKTKLFRLWGRYSSPRSEMRVGLQKITFGPGQILRPLGWFDTLDPKDPTGQTDGVAAIRGRYFAGDSWNLWAWAVRPDDPDLVASGGRIEKTFSLGDAAFTYHHRPAYLLTDLPKWVGINLLPAAGPEDRFAIDTRLDIGIGLWSEMVYSKAPDMNRGLVMAGGDYTFNIGNGLYVLLEHLVDIKRGFASGRDKSRQFTAIMGNYPIGISESVVLIIEYDWQRRLLFNYLRAQRNYDRFSLNLIMFANPDRDELGSGSPSTLTGFGTGIQIMVIYNH